jgi:hypothetical protein
VYVYDGDVCDGDAPPEACVEARARTFEVDLGYEPQAGRFGIAQKWSRAAQGDAVEGHAVKCYNLLMWDEV